MSNGKVQPAIAQTPVCPLGRSCHVSGKGIKRFGSRFSRALVAKLASSSVALVNASTKTPFASGTLVGRNVVLCCSHSLQSSPKLEVLLGFECDKKTAPAGSFQDYISAGDSTASVERNKAFWRKCTELKTEPQAKVVEVLEEGRSPFDFALLRIQWKSTVATKKGDFIMVKLPRIPKIPDPSRKITDELLVIGYAAFKNVTDPDTGLSQPVVGPAEASAGKKIKASGEPHPTEGRGDTYGTATFRSVLGYSGGGVFNQDGDIVGVLIGRDPAKGVMFLNLGDASEKTIAPGTANTGRLNAWFSHGPEPTLTSDTSDPILFTT